MEVKKKRKRSKEDTHAKNRHEYKAARRAEHQAKKKANEFTLAIKNHLRSDRHFRKNKIFVLRDYINSDNSKPIPPPFDRMASSIQRKKNVSDFRKNSRASLEWKQTFIGMLDLIENTKMEKWLDNRDLVESLCLIVDRRDKWIRPLEDFKVRLYSTDRQFFLLLRHLFAKYDVPVFMDKAWLVGSDFERCWFIELGMGKNIRKCESIPIELTKKMSHYFTQAPKELSIKQSFRFAQIMGIGGNPRTAKKIISTRLGESFQHEDFWVSVIQFFINNPMLDPCHYGPIIDFIYNQKFEEQPVVIEGHLTYGSPQPGFSMHKRDPEALLRQVERWHERLQKNDINKQGYSWPHCDIEDFSIIMGTDHNKRIWQINQILSSKELFAEGRALSHCVSSYVGSCARLQTTIWSMKLSNIDVVSKNILTIEMSPKDKRIHQIRGKFNRGPENEEMNIISKWAAKENLTISQWLY